MFNQANATFNHQENNSKLLCLKEVRKADMEVKLITKNDSEGILERSNEAVSSIQAGITEAVAAKTRVEENVREYSMELSQSSNIFSAETQNNLNIYLDLSKNALDEENKMKDRSITMLSHAKKDLDIIRNHTDKFCENSMGQVDSTRNFVDDFHLKVDRPTCRTPSKLQVLEWPSERPQTSPHAKIIHRMRKLRSERGSGKSVFDIEDSSTIVLNKSSSSISSGHISSNASGSQTDRKSLGLSERDGNIVVDESEFDQMKITELRSALKERGLSCTGTKQILKDRLRRFSLGENVLE